MKIPIMEPATGVYLDAIRKYIKFRQVPLMSADYIIGGKKYRLVGLYKKGWFSRLANGVLNKFVVVDQSGAIVRDLALSKKALNFYYTLETLCSAERRIYAALKHDPSFYEQILEKAEDIVEFLMPVMQKMRLGEEKYRRGFQHFFDFLKLWNEKSILLESLARELSELLPLVLKRQPINQETYERIKKLVIQFIYYSDIRSFALIDLELEGHLFAVKLILLEAKCDKTKYRKIIENMKTIVRESYDAIQVTRMEGLKYDNTMDLNKIKKIVQKQRGSKEDMIDDHVHKVIDEKWLLRG
ncbi:hypothetical protein [Geobacillus sp. C56-T2]|uniref:hypothetical protein n=1 Tax=Geobacillus sp. C56-T2 TaxID=600773 RepID=UPI0011A7EC9C|nr:hypothetical protein [Geobacillus sp. C56-T2]TWG32128.1 hypothetical protein GC56T2_3406 [Geobacillus sp. C56-T2]